MAYLLKFVDEYNNVNYYDMLNHEVVEFATVEEAEKKARELLDMEYEDFCSAITKYSVVELPTKACKEIKSFKVSDDAENNECILSCTDDAVNILTGAFSEAQKSYDCAVVSDKTYENGSRVLRFKYKEKEHTTKVEDKLSDIVLAKHKNTFVVAYKVKDHIEMSALARVLKDKYKDEITLYSNERDLDSGTYLFNLLDKGEEFKEDFLNLSKIFFNVKIVEK